MSKQILISYLVMGACQALVIYLLIATPLMITFARENKQRTDDVFGYVFLGSLPYVLLGTVVGLISAWVVSKVVKG